MPVPRELRVVLRRVDVVRRRREHVEPAAVAAPVRGALEAAEEEAVEHGSGGWGAVA
jgi:hypothetical protein